MKDFVLRHAGACTGMYWRRHPETGGSFSSPPDWPRNGAILRGHVHKFPAKPEASLEWLEVLEYKQSGAAAFQPTPGCWMQFDQHGRLLHPA